jgi:HAD superfamily phosphatase (TIGR01668 family)
LTSRSSMRIPALSVDLVGELQAEGIEALLLDLDNTLCDPRGDAATEEASAFCAGMREAGMRGYILTNGRRGRAEQLAQTLGFPCIARAHKPLPGAYRRALRDLRMPKEAVAAIGDQFFTDGLGAICIGMRLVLVEPRFARDKPLVRLLSPLDRIVRRLIPMR